MSQFANTFRFGLISLALCAPISTKATAQDKDLPVLATASIACNGVPDDKLKKDIETLFAFGIANANIDRRAKGEQEMPLFKFDVMPPELTEKFIKKLRETGANEIAGRSEKLVARCSDFAAPKLGS